MSESNEPSGLASKARDSLCSTTAALVGEPLAGTASVALVWIAIEQLGAYGSDALTESHFPPEIGSELKSRASKVGAKVVLIRPVGKHSLTSTPSQPAVKAGPRNVWIARSIQHKVEMVHIVVNDPSQLLDFDFQRLKEDDLQDVIPGSTLDDEPLLLICTHAKRDICCAKLGLTLGVDLVESLGSSARIWESSHLGGHRFAPTAVQLPHGWMFGRLDSASAQHVWARTKSGKLSLDHSRGRSSLIPQAQVADLAVRTEFGLDALDETFTIRDVGSDEREIELATSKEVWIVSTTSDSWEVDIVEEPLEDRPESCSKEPSSALAYRANAIRHRKNRHHSSP